MNGRRERYQWMAGNENVVRTEATTCKCIESGRESSPQSRLVGCVRSIGYILGFVNRLYIQGSSVFASLSHVLKQPRIH